MTGVPRIRRVLDSLVSRPANGVTMNAFAMILSRRAEAPKALTSSLVEQIVGLASHELIALIERRSFNVRFKYVLSAVAGLFRYREIEPFALLAARDPAAQGLRASLDRAADTLALQRGRLLRVEEMLALISSIRDLLDGAGDPAILVRIERLDEDGTEPEE